ncbi:MAG: MarR family transcriptional regulator [Actinomycetota bacterium]|nr:MarR family transcriptional regulator [Actinomycetota bacterium]
MVEPGGTASEATSAVRALVGMARMLEHVCSELTLPQYRLLVMVASGDCRATRLAGRLALSKPTVTAVVDGLVERRLLARSEVAGDRRAVQLSLTDAGTAALAATERAMVERLSQVLARCDDPGVALAGLGQLEDAITRVVLARMAEGSR